MPQIQWKMELSIGNIMSIITMIVAAAVGWQAMSSRIERNAVEVQRIQVWMAGHENRDVEFLDTISEMRVQQTEAIVSLQGEVRRLREDVNKLQDTLLETFKLGSGKTPQ
jgi:hypothetical protein